MAAIVDRGKSNDGMCAFSKRKKKGKRKRKKER